MNQDWKSTEPQQWKPAKEGEILQGFLTLKKPRVLFRRVRSGLWLEAKHPITRRLQKQNSW